MDRTRARMDVRWGIEQTAARSGRRAEVAESFLADSDAHDGPVLLTVPPLPAEPIASSVRSFPVWLTAAPSAELDWYVTDRNLERSSSHHAFRTAHFASMPAESGTSRTARAAERQRSTGNGSWAGELVLSEHVRRARECGPRVEWQCWHGKRRRRSGRTTSPRS